MYSKSRDYWKKEQERLADMKGQFEEFLKTNGEKAFSPVMKKEKKNAVVYLCLSMTRAGKGFSSRDRFGAAVKFPEKREEFLPSFIMAIHEMTHQFSSSLVMKAENLDLQAYKHNICLLSHDENGQYQGTPDDSWTWKA